MHAYSANLRIKIGVY